MKTIPVWHVNQVELVPALDKIDDYSSKDFKRDARILMDFLYSDTSAGTLEEFCKLIADNLHNVTEMDIENIIRQERKES